MAAAGGGESRDVYELLVQLRADVEAAGTLPLSSSPRFPRDEILGVLDEALDKLPDELRAARHLLKERKEYLEKTKRDGREILEAARQRAEAMIQKQTIVRQANKRAEAIVEEAETKARQLQHEAEDYVDQKLAAFEVVLERIMVSVAKGRDRLQVHVATPQLSDDVEEPESAFFDQDDS